jgi:hypothetical protein
VEEARVNRVAPWVLWGASVLLCAGGLAIHIFGGTPIDPDWGFRGAQGVLALVFVTVGAVIASQRPGHAIGRILISLGSLSALLYLAEEYVAFAIAERQGEGLAFETMASLQDWSWVVLVALIGFLLLLFPDGKLAGRAERRAARVLVVSATTAGLAWAFLSPYTEVPGVGRVDNPFAVGTEMETAEIVGGIFTLAMMVCLAVCGVLLFLRFRRATGVLRKQLEWFVYAALFASLANVVSLVGITSDNSFFGWTTTLSTLGIASIAVAAGVAVLRYRLYEIDIIVNRALVYGSLTALLALVYVGLVVVLQTGFESFLAESDLAVAASTLAVAALFRPLRNVVQDFIDRRFYRSKYDSAQALEDFGRRLRDEVNLDVLNRDITKVLRDTVRPAHAALWMRSGETA